MRDPDSADDLLLRFLLGRSGVRGVLVIDGKEVSLPGAPAGTAQVVANGVTLAANGYSVAVKPGSGSAVLTINGPQGETTFAPGSWNCAR